jgi:signal transduction histidine kinase
MIRQPEHFDSLVTLSGDLFFVLDPGGLVIDLSSSISQELGHSPDDLQKKNFSQLILPADLKIWESEQNAAKSSPLPREFELRILNRAQQEVQTRGRICFLLDQKIFLVTLRKLSSAEEKLPQMLQHTLDHLNVSLKSAQMGIWESQITQTPEGEFHTKLKWDPEMHRIHGAPTDQKIDELDWFLKHIHPEDFPDLQKKMVAFITDRGSGILRFNYRVCWLNGETHYIDMYGSLQEAAPGETMKMYGVAKDITQDVLKQQLFADQKNRMISSSRMAVIGEISGGIAHEINNPLTVIQARSFQLLQMAEQNTLDAVKVKAAADSISKTGDKIAKIVKSLRAFAHSQENPPMDCVRIHELIEETLDFCKVRFYNHGVEIRMADIPEELEVDCRLIQIEEVLLNLFNNAHDAVLKLPEKWIAIEAEDKGKDVEIHITDSGSGIPENIADNIMLPFFTTKEIGRGMGLGLSIVSDIVAKHQGQIFLDRNHTNTRFVLRLPKHQL